MNNPTTSYSGYNTKARQLILKASKKIATGFTPKELQVKLNESGSPLGLATIYRQLEKLAQAKFLKKLPSGTGPARFLFLSPCSATGHLYLECTNCQKLIHVDCTFAESFNTHILKKHHFTLENQQTLIRGLCAACAKEHHDL